MHDDFSFKRVVNKPRRGIGKTTLDKLEYGALEAGTSMFGFIMNSSVEGLQTIVSKKASKTLKDFCVMIDELSVSMVKADGDFLDEFEEMSGLRAMYKASNEAERVQNIDEFYALLREFLKQYPDDGIDQFLNDIALSSEQDGLDGEQVSMMSVHAAKGLEFEMVFIIGLEDGFFPLMGDGSDLEEERRLGYVAFTRAKRELILSHVNSRFFRGKRDFMQKSRFLSESGVIKGSLKLASTALYKKGDLVKHKIFGMGRVMAVTKVGKDSKLTINFGGNKRDILSSFVSKI